MSTTQTPPPQLDPQLCGLLASLRGRIRAYVAWHGLATTVAAAATAFWAALTLDWMFEPPPVGRIAIVAVLGLAVAWVFLRYFVGRQLLRLRDANMAMLLERRFGEFNDSLLTAVQLTEKRRSAPADEFSAEMLSHTCLEAAAHAGTVQLDELFNRRPLERARWAAGLLASSILVFAVVAPGAFWFFTAERMVSLSDELWPRRAYLVIDGFDNEGREAVIAIGSDLTIDVKAMRWLESGDGAEPEEKILPEVVQVRWRTQENQRDRDNMVREGNAAPEDDFQLFRYTFQNVLTSRSFDVVGNDYRIRDLSIRVVESPTIPEMTLHCEYPAYTNRSADELPATGAMQLPQGTRVTIRARANKDLEWAEVGYAGETEGDAASRVLPTPGDARRFEFTLDQLDDNRTLSFTLLDTDGIRNRDPIRLALTAVADEAPELNVRLAGIGQAIVPQARMPLVGEIVDDYGVARVWVDYEIDEGGPQEAELNVEGLGRAELAIDDALDARPLNLTPGQHLVVGTKAQDTFQLTVGDEPNEGQGERFPLAVVTPEELRAMLESRELNLRQRFEQIIAEVVDTRDLLARLDFEEPQGASSSEDDAADEPTNDEPPADNAVDDAVEAPEPQPRALERRMLRVEAVLRNTQKNAPEILGVSEAFEEIRHEFVNNRMDTEELNLRLQNYIADPLREVAEVAFPELDGTLIDLKTQLADAAAGRPLQKAAVAQLDTIVVQLESVRDRMLELESFNEALELLRDILAAQQELNERTKKVRSDKLRQLLE